MTHTFSHSVWAILPAAGIGRRMGASIPKQYLMLSGRPVIHWSLAPLLSHPWVQGAVVALHPDDHWWPQTRPDIEKPLFTVRGGAERFESVFNALSLLMETVDPSSWVMVHDAVRPCVMPDEINRLLKQGTNALDGALLASPVHDTLKRQDDTGRVDVTVSRAALWHALTPQVYPLQTLHQAIGAVISDNRSITDEAQAMELAGYRPLLIESAASNLKITRPADLQLAESILRAHFPGAEK